MNDWSEAAVWLLLRLEDNPSKKTFEEFLDYVKRHYGLTTASYMRPSLSMCLIKDPCIAMAYSDALIDQSEAMNGTPKQSASSIEWTFLPRLETILRRMIAEPSSAIGRNGLTVPVYFGGRPQALAVFTSSEPQNAWTERRHELAISLTRVAHYLHYCVGRLDGDEAAIDVNPLNALEIEALMIASHGKSLAEVALTMRSSKAAASAHLDSARHKLCALNVSHAVWKAVSARLID